MVDTQAEREYDAGRREAGMLTTTSQHLPKATTSKILTYIHNNCIHVNDQTGIHYS